MPWSLLPMSNSVMPAARAASRVWVMKLVPPGMRVASPRPGRVSTMWSIVQNTCSGLRTRRFAAASSLRATLPVRSWRNTRSMYSRLLSSPSSATRCSSQILSMIVRAMRK
ncbi:MAG: hypothetical protein M5R42_10085 [Rhodocyclaceae bacterium]|nr:hypothetical protein [Rhodocyclaceae bacterium]